RGSPKVKLGFIKPCGPEPYHELSQESDSVIPEPGTAEAAKDRTVARNANKNKRETGMLQLGHDVNFDFPIPRLMERSTSSGRGKPRTASWQTIRIYKTLPGRWLPCYGVPWLMKLNHAGFLFQQDLAPTQC
ncbi:hypothetical protein ATANTOWER_025481, partial [Ataeniobius toweri]|nr:hypothetical protein [Ataeniobius toweri]